MDETSKYIETYRQEAEELLADIEENILDLEEDPNNMEALNRLFRSMHTIKGSGAMFGFDDIAGFTHHVETFLDKVRDGIVPVTSELIDLILASRDQIKMMLDAADTGETVDMEISGRIIAALERLLPGVEETESAVPSEKTEEATYRIIFRPDPEIFASGTDPALLLDELRELGECMIVAQTEDVPRLDNMNPETCYLFWDIILTTSHSLNTVKDVFIFVEDESRIIIEKIVKDFSEDADIIVPRLGEILVDRGDASPEDVSEVLEPHQERIGKLFVESGVVPQDRIKAALSEQKVLDKQRARVKTSTVRVPSDKLDSLINLVGELVITQAHLTQVVASAGEIEEIDLMNPLEAWERITSQLANPVETLERLTSELRDCALNMRMVPIGITFGKFRRLIRDLSVELGKDIELITEGAETELDKTVIERLNDPLVHLLRNSIDHGIQLPDERVRSGKPSKGIISLSAAHRGPKVVISIEDDGIGIDPDLIRARALERGLITEDADIPEKEILSLIFTPGFSTTDQVTSISGRGVGMDVVKREIDSLGGSIQIFSEKDRYSRISLSLPLTLAIIDGLLVDVAGDFFVLPLAQVEECAELTKALVEKSQGRNMILVRGELIPFIRLREIFGMPGKVPETEHIAVVQVENFRVGILVDEIIGNIQTVIKSLDRNYKDAETISGATIMGDGKVALVIDVAGLIRCARHEEKKGLKIEY